MLTALTLAALLAADGEPRSVELKAEQLLRDGVAKRTTAEGNARLTTAGAALSANHIVYDEEKKVATATGDVSLRIVQRGLIAVAAEAVAVTFEGEEVSEVFIYGGQAVRKKNTTAEKLLAAETPEQLAAAGEVMMTLTGSHLKKSGNDWVADDIIFVPCDCDFQNPIWGIHAAVARVNFDDERVSLVSPTVRIKGIPVLWLPWISLPLTERQTGLLVPKPTFSGLSGFGLEQPVFITLGQSADLTLTAGGFFGNADTRYEREAMAAYRRGEGFGFTRDNTSGIAGPKLSAEFRYTPSREISGRINLGLVYDFRAQRDPINASLRVPEERGLRGDFSLQHRQRLFEQWHFDAAGTLLTDGYYLRDITADVLAREAFYTRSLAAVYRRGEETWLSLDVLLRQDVSWGYSLFKKDPLLEPGIPRRGPNPLHRLPALTFAVPERTLVGPLTFNMRAEFVRLSPISGNTGDEGPSADEGRSFAIINGEQVNLRPECVQERLYAPVRKNPSACPADLPMPDERAYEGDRLWQPGERQSRDRFDAFPRLSVRGSLADVVALSAWAGWRQDVWLAEVDGGAAWRGYPLFAGRADSELAKVWKTDDGAVRHAISGSVELRGTPVIFGQAPVPYDEVDAAMPDNAPRLQAVAELRNRVSARHGTSVQEHLRLDLGQGAELVGPDGPRLAESYGRLGIRAGWFSGDVSVRLDAPRGRVSRVSATAGLEDGRGRGLYAGWENVLDDGTDRTRQPIDLLFGSRAGPGNARAQALTFGGHFRIEGFTARYEAMMFDRTYALPGPNGPGLPIAQQIIGEYKALTFVQHTLGLGYGPRCDCWRVEVYATQRGNDAPGRLGPPVYGVPDFGASVTLTNFGAFGTGG